MTEGAPLCSPTLNHKRVNGDVFNRYFPSGSIKSIKYNDLPSGAVNLFEGLSRRFILPKEYKAKDFSSIFVISNDDSSFSYGAIQRKRYPSGDEEELIYIIDFNKEGIQQGRGEIRFAPKKQDIFFRDKPFEEYTETSGFSMPPGPENFCRQGLAKRRTLMMNAIVRMLYDLPLYSSTLFVHPGYAARVWEKLVTEGKARKFKEGEEDRYVFV